jgi:branched-subunit amino acid transport protein AzlD
MPDYTYIAAALAAAVGITVTLRATPFLIKNAINESPLLTDIGRWMPLGAIAILAGYCLTTIDYLGPAHGLPQLIGVAVTVAVHLWRRNAVLSILTGTTVCIAIINTHLLG